MRAPARNAEARAWAHLVDEARALSRRYDDDPEHAERVLAHARLLLPASAAALDHPRRLEAYALRLDLAALLHDIGRCVAVREHNRHSRYLIRHLAVTQPWPEGLREEVAVLAGAHRGPVRASELRRRLRGDRDLVRLTALLRVADGLDRSHAPGVEIVRFTPAAGGWVLSASGLSERDRSRLEARKADLFSHAFGATITIQTELAPLRAARGADDAG